MGLMAAVIVVGHGKRIKGIYDTVSARVKGVSKEIEKIEMTSSQKGSIAKIFAQGNVEIQKEVKELLDNMDKGGILEKISNFEYTTSEFPTIESLISGDEKVPIKTEGVDRWFDSLTSEECNQLWEDSSIKKTIKNRLRDGKNHE